MQSVSFETIVDKDKCSTFRFGRLAFADEPGARLSRVGVGFFYSVVGLKQSDCLFVLAARSEQKARGCQVWNRVAALKSHLLAHGRHFRPRFEYMSHPVSLKGCKIVDVKEVPVSYFHRVRPALRQSTQK